MADVEKAEPEYVPADYVAPADAAEQTKGGSRWAPVCDWPLAFREALEVFPARRQVARFPRNGRPLARRTPPRRPVLPGARR